MDGRISPNTALDGDECSNRFYTPSQKFPVKWCWLGFVIY